MLCRIGEVTETHALDTDLAEQMLGLLQQQQQQQQHQQQQRQPIGEAKVLLESAALRDTTLDAKLSELEHVEEHDGDAHAKRVRPLSKLAQMMKRCLKEEKKSWHLPCGYDGSLGSSISGNGNLGSC